MKISLQLITLLLLSSPAHANNYITPMIGYSFGGNVSDTQDVNYQVKANPNLAITVETDLDKGRIGAFYSLQQTDIKKTSNDLAINYLHFQSALNFPLNSKLSSFFGLSVGGTYIKADWVDKDLSFSAGAFTGIRYQFSDNASLHAEGRWLASSVDSDFSAICQGSPESTQCKFKFEGDWLHQGQANLGITFVF
ncbi:MAG: porin family protein [Aliivibrio sp.]|uniref:porin family protein n=1 Tax=Aliivibrio sp. TaxID=1872443 RepID=UPI001A648252|nr:porin family protein [Aliivibrio sp.]